MLPIFLYRFKLIVCLEHLQKENYTNPRMVGVRRDLWKSSPTSMLKQACLEQVAQDNSRQVVNISR